MLFRGTAAAIALLTAGTLGGCGDGNRSTPSRLPRVEQTGQTDTLEPRVDSAAARLEAVLLESTPPAYVPAFVWDVVRRYYDARRYAPRWTGPAGGLTQEGRALVAVLCALETEGLASPVLSALPDSGNSTRTIAQSAVDLGELDLRLTAALLTAADALRSGQVHPDSLVSAWHVAAPETISDTAAAALLADSVPARALLTLRKSWPGYRSLVEAARQLRASEAAEDTIAKRRFDLVAANMERYRWLPGPAERGPMLLVDLATGRVEGHADGQLTWTGAARAGPCSAGLPPMLADTIHGVRGGPGGFALELGNRRRVRLVSRIAAAGDPGEPCIVVSKPAAAAEFVRRTGQPVLLYLLWPTTRVDQRDGRLHFRHDPSGQDEALKRALPQTARTASACTR